MTPKRSHYSTEREDPTGGIREKRGRALGMGVTREGWGTRAGSLQNRNRQG